MTVVFLQSESPHQSFTQSSTTSAPAAAIDENSLLTGAANPTITGTAVGTKSIVVVISSHNPSDPWGATLGDWFGNADVESGRWSLKVEGISQTTYLPYLKPGIYTVYVRVGRTNVAGLKSEEYYIDGQTIATGTLKAHK
jgi:hypothetical protein